MPNRAASEAMLMTDPPPLSRMTGTTALQQFQMPLTLTAMASSHSPGSMSSNRPPVSAP